MSGRDADQLAPREVLAGISNTWLYPREIAKAREAAATSTDEECAAELDRLERSISHRIEAWRWSQ